MSSSTAVDAALPGQASGLLDATDPDLPHLWATLHGLVRDPIALCEWLKDCRTTDRATEIARRSYWHPNGFAKLVLHAGPAVRVRMHVWPAGSGRAGESNPHGHRWEFASTVLCGDGLSSTSYTESPDGCTYQRYCYVGGNLVGSLQPVGPARLVADGTRVIPTGGRYVVGLSDVHTIHPLGTALVATLVVQGPPRVDGAVVYCAPGQEADQPGLPLATTDVQDLLGSVLAATGETAGGL